MATKKKPTKKISPTKRKKASVSRPKNPSTAAPKVAHTSTQKEPRRFKQPAYRPFRLGKRIKHPGAPIPSAFKLYKQSLQTLRTNKKLFAGIAAIYCVLTIILVRGFSGGLNLGEVKTALQAGTNGHLGSLGTAATLFGYMLASAGSSSSATGGVYQTLLIILVSVVVIWTLRQVTAGHTIRVRDAYYRGTYSLVPFILVLITVGIQLIPMAIGGWVYSTVTSIGIASNGPEQVAWGAFFLVASIFSIYMLCSSVFALYIVTLPDMTPMRALRSARQLVLHRRWTVLRKILFLPLALLILSIIIIMPTLLIASGLAETMFFILTTAIIVLIHSYMYSLYRALL